MAVWKGSLILQNCPKPLDLQIHPSPPDHSDVSVCLNFGSTLRFLSLVETARIPLHIALGPRCEVVTTSEVTEAWFNNLLFNKDKVGVDDEDEATWWEQARLESPLGVLVAVETADIVESGLPRVTEILFYVSLQTQRQSRRLPTPPCSSPASENARGIRAKSEDERTFRLKALLLSSDLLNQSTEPTPSPSPSPSSCGEEEVDAVFLPPRFPVLYCLTHEPVNELATKKRRSINDTFDEAAERRKKARRKGGERVAAAAARGDTAPTAVLKPWRAVSEDASQLQHSAGAQGLSTDRVALQTWPLSRSPGVASQPGSTKAPSEAPRRSALSQVYGMSTLLGKASQSTPESRNKDIISRVVMAGMRLYGLVQSKSRKLCAGSAAASPAQNISFVQREQEREENEEYKLVYHQVFKGACFTLRVYMATESLQPRTHTIRDIVDRLLALYCIDPLAHARGNATDERTPSGRQAFGSAFVDEDSPFLFPRRS